MLNTEWWLNCDYCWTLQTDSVSVGFRALCVYYSIPSNTIFPFYCHCPLPHTALSAWNTRKQRVEAETTCMAHVRIVFFCWLFVICGGCLCRVSVYALNARTSGVNIALCALRFSHSAPLCINASVNMVNSCQWDFYVRWSWVSLHTELYRCTLAHTASVWV